MSTILSSSDSAPMSYVAICCIAEAPFNLCKEILFTEKASTDSLIFMCVPPLPLRLGPNPFHESRLRNVKERVDRRFCKLNENPTASLSKL
jgi:hypothetical protein